MEGQSVKRVYRFQSPSEHRTHIDMLLMHAGVYEDRRCTVLAMDHWLINVPSPDVWHELCNAGLHLSENACAVMVKGQYLWYRDEIEQ